MKLPKRLLAVASIASGAAIPLLFAANAANAATPTTVKAVTHLANRDDTCDAPTGMSDANGNVWAHDDISRQFTITHNHDGTYTVNVTDNGSFSAFAEPNNDDQNTIYPISATGSIKGTETWQVTSPQGPDTSTLPSQIGNAETTTQMIDGLFPNSSTVNANMMSYAFNYRSDNGSTYAQTYTYSPLKSSITGNITG